MAEKKKALEKVYYCAQANCCIDVCVKDDNGDVKFLYDKNGNPTIVDGSPVPLQKTIRFLCVDDHPERLQCLYVCDDKTPQFVIDALEERAEGSESGIYSYNDWVKRKNPAQAAEILRREALEKEVSELKSEKQGVAKELEQKDEALASKAKALESANSQIEDFRKKLKKLGG